MLVHQLAYRLALSLHMLVIGFEKIFRDDSLLPQFLAFLAVHCNMFVPYDENVYKEGTNV